METHIHSEERCRFHRLQRVGREEHAAAVRKMSRAELRRYVGYLREIQRLSIEEYDALFGRRQIIASATTGL